MITGTIIGEISTAMIAARPGMLERDRPRAASVPRQVARIVVATATMTESFSALGPALIGEKPRLAKIPLASKTPASDS